MNFRADPLSLTSLSLGSCLFAFALSLGLPSEALAAPKYKALDLGAFGTGFAYGFDINNSGDVVGYALDPNFNSRAFVYHDGVYRELGIIGNSYAYGINNQGQIYGNYFYENGGGTYYLYSDGVVTPLPIAVSSINNHGVLVGIGQDSAFHTLSYLYQNGELTDLTPILGAGLYAEFNNDSGALAGLKNFGSGNDINVHAYVFANGEVSWIPSLGANLTIPFDFNNNNMVVGSANLSNGSEHVHPFLYKDGRTTDLMKDSPLAGAAWGLNDVGAVVGESFAEEFLPHRAFLYTDGTMIDLNSLVDLQDVLVQARAINNHGQIVANSNNTTYLLTPIAYAIPESSTVASCGVLVLILSSCFRHWRRASSSPTNCS